MKTDPGTQGRAERAMTFPNIEIITEKEHEGRTGTLASSMTYPEPSPFVSYANMPLVTLHTGDSADI